MSDVARNLKRLRQKRRMTQEELAEKLHVTRQAVSNWETGKNQPDVETLKRLAETLGTDVKELLYAPAPEEKGQRRMIALVVWTLTAAAWLAFALLYDKAAVMKHHYDTRMFAALLLGLRPLAYLLLGAALAALLSAWRCLPPVIRSLGRGMLAAGAVFLLIYALGALCWLGGIGGYKLHLFWASWGMRYSWTFLLPGIFLFCGLSRKAG